MSAILLEGRKLAEEIRNEVRKEAALLSAKAQVPRLVVVSVGKDPGSEVYVGQKKKACRDAGIEFTHRQFPEGTDLSVLSEELSVISRDRNIHAVIVQLPLPTGIDEGQVIRHLDPSKDVDGLHPLNIGLLARGEDGFVPCTPLGILELIKRNNISLDGANVVILGRSNLVGRPLSILLSQKKPGLNATVTLCHTGTKNLKQHTREADILVSCAGKPGTVTEDMVSAKTVVIDVGITRIERDGKQSIIGDVDFERVSRIVRAITPVPGGVGPLTVAMLLRNTVTAAKRQFELSVMRS
ncbi:MAG: bifunctional 5,10-methylenetetrahydrofolate dehydrogenase/5,10-methenyltetrahydrofolate cyclohydrolase [Candidatus Eisenbacteria bacterium]|nr:bifunctional 5,10-methylenetetrahydrofolate dehydrogenase/5,10-methenyltetrahydrofolate cyclohydrolase [Candidatus Eisenbacteria bacterium]